MIRTICIDDDFDLEKIRLSGQCFRVHRLSGGWYMFIAGDRVLMIREAVDGAGASGGVLGGAFEVTCAPEEWRGFWHGYFDLDRNYAETRHACRGKSEFVDEAMEYGRGLRILKQDPWEMLVTFIISQRKNMPAIASSVQAVSEKFGAPIKKPCACADVCKGLGGDAAEPLYAFPTPEQLAAASEEDLRSCSLGYRAPYIAETARQVVSGELDLEALAECSDEELFEGLQKARGVGAKVANCVCLFGYGRTSRVPVDVWIARAIDEECEGDNPFEGFGDDSGVMQQYVFFYMTDRNRK